MSSKFIDDVYTNEYIPKEKSIYSKENLQFEEELKKEVEKKQLEDIPDELFERLLAEARENPTKPFTKEEAFIISKKLEENKKEAKVLLKNIKDKKDSLYKRVVNSPDKFNLDISKNSNLKRSANRVFGGNKQEVTYEDYATLLEMRKQLQLNESLDILAREDLDHGNV